MSDKPEEEYAVLVNSLNKNSPESDFKKAFALRACIEIKMQQERTNIFMNLLMPGGKRGPRKQKKK